MRQHRKELQRRQLLHRRRLPSVYWRLHLQHQTQREQMHPPGHVHTRRVSSWRVQEPHHHRPADSSVDQRTRVSQRDPTEVNQKVRMSRGPSGALNDQRAAGQRSDRGWPQRHSSARPTSPHASRLAARSLPSAAPNPIHHGVIRSTLTRVSRGTLGLRCAQTPHAATVRALLPAGPRRREPPLCPYAKIVFGFPPRCVSSTSAGPWAGKPDGSRSR